MNPLQFNTQSLNTVEGQTVRRAEQPGVRPAGRREEHASPTRGVDRVELSTGVRAGQNDPEAPVRLELVRRVREALAKGTYETSEKVAIAADRAAKDVDLLA